MRSAIFFLLSIAGLYGQMAVPIARCPIGAWTDSQCVTAYSRRAAPGLPPGPAAASGFIINTFAGTDYTFPGDGQPALNAPLGFLVSVAIDPAGNLYIADQSNRMILSVGTDGILHVIAGTGILGDSGDEGDADNASLGDLEAVTIAPDGDLYIAIFGGLIRRVSPDGIIHAVANLKLGAGSGIGAHSQAIAVDAARNVYYADAFNHRIRKISPTGTVTTIAGTGQPGFSGDGGPATAAALNFPRGVRIDPAGNLLIVDTGNKRIRKVAPDGTISSVAAKTAFGEPDAVEFDAAGNIYTLESITGNIRKIAPDGTVTLIAGSGTKGFSGDGGQALNAQFNFPAGLALDSSGNIFVADTFNNRVRRISTNGFTSTFAGNGLYRFTPEGTPAALGFFRSLYGIAVDSKGSLYIADRDDARIKKVLADGTLVTVAGTGQDLASGNGPLPAAITPIALPAAPAVDAKGNLYFIENGFRVRRATPDGTISTYAGGGANPGDNIPATSAFLDVPISLAIDSAGNLYISENGSTANRIRKVSPNGTIATIAGAGPAGFSGDGGQAIQAQLKRPSDIALDQAGNIYFLDTGNSRVRKIDKNGIISTYVGGGSSTAEGVTATQASINLYAGLALDAASNLYVVDNGRGVVRVVSPGGTIMTLAGSGKFGFSGDGGPSLLASFEFPNGLAVDPSGNLYIADALNFRVRVVTAAAPTFTRSPASLSFTVRSGDASPAPLQVALTSSLSGLPYTVSASTTTGGNWLRTSASSPVVPATVNVTVDPSALAPATYQGSITFTPGIAGITSLTTSVTLVVQPPAPSLLAVDTKGLSFSFVRGASAASRRVLVQNSGGGTVSFTTSVKTASGGTWLSASPARGSATPGAPESLIVTADPTGLAAGTYSGAVTVADVDGTTSLLIPVTLTISNSGQSIRLAQKGLTFVAVVGGGASPTQNIALLNTGQGTVPFTAQSITAAGLPDWISVTPSGGNTAASQPSTLTVSVNPAGLSAGDYFARIQIVSTSADNSPQEAVAVLHLLPAGTDPGPGVQPAALVFTGATGGADPSAQAVQVTNLTAGPITFGSSAATVDGAGWLTYQPATATVPPGSIRLIVQPRLTGLPVGVYRGAIVLVFSNGGIQTIGVLLVVAPGSAGPSSARDAAGCAPSQLLPLITSLGSNFNVPASFPTPIEVRVVDDCGNPTTTGSVVTTFSNGDPALSLISLNDGRWSGTWLSRNVSQNQLSITVAAEIPQQQLKGTVQVSGGLNGNASPPVINAGGVVSASSLNGQAPLSPGAMVSIFGAKMSSGTAGAPSLPLGTQLAGASVLVAGKSLPLLYSSDGQINALLPFDIPVNARIQMLVSRGAQISVPEEISIAPAQPGVFTTNGTGQGQGHIYVAASNGSQRLADQAAPARAGDVIVIYCSGLGPVDQPVADGASAPVSPLARTVNPVILTIGGVSTNAFFSGLAPGFSGLYQINAFVPQGVAAGGQVPVIINIAGQASPPVTMAVR